VTHSVVEQVEIGKRLVSDSW